VDFKRDAALFELPGGQEIETLESDYATTTIFHQDDIVVGFFTYMFFLGVLEPDAERIALTIKIDSYFVHNAFPFLMFLVK
jgi:hypothetical protein